MAKEEGTKESPRIEAIDRALVLLTALAEAGPKGVSLAALSEQTGVNKSTAFRALATLRARGYAHQTPAGDHVLGASAMNLADSFLSRDHLVAHLHPALLELSLQSEELVHLGAWADDEIVYLDKVEPAARAIRVWSAVGQRVPIATSALGRVLLAARGVPEEQLGVYAHAVPENRRISTQRLQDIVRETRGRGFSTEIEENEPGVACVGFALMRGGDAVAALSITTLASRMTPARCGELVMMVRRRLPALLPHGITLFQPGESQGAGDPKTGGSNSRLRE